MRTLSHRLIIGTLGFLFLAEGCQVYNAGANFLSQRYINTVSYFNTYYNAQRAFDDAEKEVLVAQKAQQAKPGLAVQGNPISSTARTKFNTAIEKASKLLSFYPTCKWVDDALFLIGKSYFYLDDNLKAERKFLELIAKFPDSDLRFEAELWYGRSLLRQKRYDDGVQSLDNLYTKAAENKEKEIAALASLAIAKHFFEAQEYGKAAKYFQQSVAISTDDELNADTQLQIGYCYRAMNELSKASQAFTSVEEFDPDYATSFTAKLENVRILSELRQYDDALARLSRFLEDAKNSENFSKIHCEMGAIYLSQNRIDDAIAKFSYVDTTFAKTEEAARAYFELGKIYETNQNNYTQARFSYNKAKVEYPASRITSEATRKADAFAKYFGLRSDLAKYDSLVVDLRGRKGKRDSLNSDREGSHQNDSAKVAERTVMQKTLQAKTDSLAPQDSLRFAAGRRLEVAELHDEDSLRQLIVKGHFELAGIFYLEINQPDSALFWYQKAIDEGGSSEIAPRALFTVAEIYRTSKGKEKGFLDSLYRAIISKYPDSPYAQESRRALGIPLLSVRRDPAEELYANAETYIDGASPDSALQFLCRIVNENSASSFSVKALYAIGWLYENRLGNRDSASAVYRRLIAGYPQSQFAAAVRPKIQEEDNAKKEGEQKAKEELDAKKKKDAEQKKVEKESEDAKLKPAVSKEQP
jgi:tetratricopeptide (TPR) repeat protein